MIVACPTCKARYQIDDAKVGDQGLQLKCTKCASVFRVKKPPVAAAAPGAAPPRPAAPPPAPGARPPVPARPPAPAPQPRPPAPAAPRPGAPAPRPAAPPPRPAPAPAPRPAAPPPPAPRPAAPPPRPAAPPPPAPRPAAPPPRPAPAPAARPPAPAPAPAAAPAAAKAPAKPLATGPYQPSTPSLGKVLVGDSDDAFLRHIARVLLQGGFTVYLAHDGAVVMELIRAKAPQVAIVDVALPKIFGFEIAEMVKNDPALKTKTRVVLLGSVYEKDRFRRQPQSLYGADEYIEKHHDGKAVLAKVRRLILGEPEPPLETEAPAEAPPPAPAAPAPPSPPRPPVPPAAPAAAKPPTAPPKPAPPPPAKAAAPVPAAPKAPPAATAPPTPDDPANQKAARLARTIVSDVALYNPDLVTRGVKEGNIYNLLAKDISDGLKHYNSRVSEEIRSQRDYFKEAMEALIAKKRAELGLG